jgi:hypothetical protein
MNIKIMMKRKTYRINSNAIITVDDTIARDLVWYLIKATVETVSADKGFMQGGFSLQELNATDYSDLDDDIAL